MKTRNPRFDRSWQDAIALYPDAADREALTTAIRDYQIDATEPELKPALMVAFNFLRPTIDRRRRNADKARQRRLKEKEVQDETVKPAGQPTAESPKNEEKHSHTPVMLTDMYGSRLENNQRLLNSIASEMSVKCRKRVTKEDVIRNISFFNDYLFQSTKKLHSEECYLKEFKSFIHKLLLLPDPSGIRRHSRAFI